MLKKYLSIIFIFIILQSASVFAQTKTSIDIVSFGSNYNRPGVITYGEVGTLAGLLYNVNNPNLKGKNITIKYHYIRESWRTLAQVTTLTNSGFFYKDHRPRHNIYYKAFFSGDSEYSASTSNVTRTIVKVKISARIRRKKGYFNLYGTVYPSKKRRLVKIIAKKGYKGKWRTIGRKRLNSRSQYRYYFRKRGRKGIYFIKVNYNGDMYNGRNNSKTLKLVI